MVVIASVSQLEVEESSLRLPDPLGLHELHTGRPLQGLQSTQQLLDDKKKQSQYQTTKKRKFITNVTYNRAQRKKSIQFPFSII